MNNIWFISDTHFGHEGMTRFTRENGTKLRPFTTVDEMDYTIFENWRKTVKPQDKVYHLGDVAFDIDKLRFIATLPGHKRLIRGNHDLFKMNEYTKIFEEVYGVKQLDGWWFTHIPIHPFSCGRKNFKGNIHGHIHEVRLGEPYVNVCVEHTNYAPINFEDIKSGIFK